MLNFLFPTELNTKSGGYIHRTLVLSEWMKQRLEYPYLSNITGDFRYWQRVKQIDGFFRQVDSEEAGAVGAKRVDEYDKMNWMLKGRTRRPERISTDPLPPPPQSNPTSNPKVVTLMTFSSTTPSLKP